MGDNQYPPQPSPIREGRSAASPFTLHFSLKQRAAFTLAEVLITLGVIGVVAALTMPSLIANYQKKVLVNKIKQTYATLNEGIRQIMVNEGCTDMICAGFMEDVRHPIFNESNRNKIINAFKLSNVETPTSNNGIYDYNIFDISGNNLGSLYVLLILEMGPVGYDDFAFIGTFPDGTVLISPSPLIAGSDYLFVFIFDVNGSQKPNVMGRDIQAAVLLKSGVIVPVFGLAFEQEDSGIKDLSGVTVSREEWFDLCEESRGIACLNLIIYDGWQMKY